jgi:hypothetical protein
MILPQTPVRIEKCRVQENFYTAGIIVNLIAVGVKEGAGSKEIFGLYYLLPARVAKLADAPA